MRNVIIQNTDYKKTMTNLACPLEYVPTGHGVHCWLPPPLYNPGAHATIHTPTPQSQSPKGGKKRYLLKYGHFSGKREDKYDDSHFIPIPQTKV